MPEPLPPVLRGLLEEWALEREPHEVWGRFSVAVPVRTADGEPAVLKVADPGLETEHEALAASRAEVEMLQALNRFKADVIRTMRHELRTPLTAILGYSGALLVHEKAEERREFLDIIRRETKRLSRMIEDFLDMSSIQAGNMRYNLHPLDLAERLFACQMAGIDKKKILVDPGFGFGKTLEHNLALLRALDRFPEIAPVMVGLSRKRSIGVLTGREDPHERVAGSVAAALIAAQRGAAIVRVHDVAPTRDALAVWHAVAAGDGAGRKPVAVKKASLWDDD